MSLDWTQIGIGGLGGAVLATLIILPAIAFANKNIMGKASLTATELPPAYMNALNQFAQFSREQLRLMASGDNAEKARLIAMQNLKKSNKITGLKMGDDNKIVKGDAESSVTFAELMDVLKNKDYSKKYNNEEQAAINTALRKNLAPYFANAYFGIEEPAK